MHNPSHSQGPNSGQEVTLDEAIKTALQYHQAGNLQAAEQIYQQVLQVHPRHAEAMHLLGVLAQQVGQLEVALTHIQAAVTIDPDMALAQGNLGNVLMSLGREDEALECFERAIDLAPEMAGFHNGLGLVLSNQGEMERALACFQRALKLDDQFTDAYNNVGNCLGALGRFMEAEAHYKMALRINPNHPQALHNMGNYLRNRGELDQAANHFRKQLEIHPDAAMAHNNLGVVYEMQGELESAIGSFQKALEIEPDLVHANNNLGNAYRDLSQMEPAMACYRAAAKGAAVLGFSAVKNYISAHLYQPQIDHETLFNICRDHRPVLPPEQTVTRPNVSLSDGEKLRIGYLGGDFRDHPVGFNILPLLSHHERCEVFCYADQEGRDSVTQKFRHIAHQWREVGTLSDAALAEQIRHDRIHILIHLAGLFDANRPQIAMHLPAPIQVSYHSAATSGLSEMDYWLTDSVLHPPENTQERFTETLLRLPHFYLFTPPKEAPPVAPLPADSNGHITFISLNNFSKITPEVIALWGEILNRTPGSRLLLKYRNVLASPMLRNQLTAAFEKCGIDPSRLELLRGTDEEIPHLALYNRADIALDPFPFTGATTTFQSLWMGVPVISLLGDRFAGRMAGDILVHGGYAELAVNTQEAYADKAVALAEDLAALRTMRQEMRPRIEASPLLDGAGYAHSFEEMLYAIWNNRERNDKPV
ncbi:MAG: tetratricopeptide repeat protein [Magnetococcales bacterium]|nr:tetratricopeptide repeat protein [Magnetococcales bacterium]